MQFGAVLECPENHITGTLLGRDGKDMRDGISNFTLINPGTITGATTGMCALINFCHGPFRCLNRGKSCDDGEDFHYSLS